MDIRFLSKNVGWAALHPKEAYAAQKAMKKYREEHPNCEITGSPKKVQVHHIIPVWADSTLAADPNNFITLSSQAHIHIIFGHAGNFRLRYVENVKEIAEEIRKIKEKSIVVNRPIEAQNTKSWLSRVYNKMIEAFFK